MPEAQQPRGAMTTDTDSYDPTGNDWWLRDALDAPVAVNRFGQMMHGTWAITITTGPNTTAQSTPTATEQPPKNDK